MKITASSQLGLMMDSEEVCVEFFQLMLERNRQRQAECQKAIDRGPKEEGLYIMTVEADTDDPVIAQNNLALTGQTTDRIGDSIGNFINNQGSKLYLICNGVEECSKMIRVGDSFSSRALRNIKFGKHTYLMGKNEVFRFLCNNNAIKGIYWNREEKAAFEFGFDLEEDGYYFDPKYAKQFSRLTKIITFVELGDIEVVTLESGRNNGKAKANGKITNGAKYTVFVVDSSWNKLIIRTEGFAVMGHFRLQPCGPGLIDRKLIWIDAFEKHGYIRRPKGEIIHD